VEEKKIEIDGYTYDIEYSRKVREPADMPRLVVVSHLLNPLGVEVLRRCLASVQHYTTDAHELWVVDNNSPSRYTAWLRDWPGINLVLNHTDPIPPDQRSWLSRLPTLLRPSWRLTVWGSYANAAGLELAARLIEPDTKYLMTMHMDTMPCHPSWLAYLRSKLNDSVAAAGVRMDVGRSPEGILHILGCLLDWQRFRQLHLGFWPQLPRYDVGDKVTVSLREAGYEVFACRNTIWQPELVATLPSSPPFAELSVDRALDDDGHVIYLHLGRGVLKSAARSGVQSKGVTAQDWIRFADTYLLALGASCQT